MNINLIRRSRLASVFMSAAMLYASLWSFSSVHAADLTISAAPSGTVIQTSDSDPTPLAEYLPALTLPSASLSASSTASATAYYGVRIQSATTTGDVHWKITVHSAAGALVSGDVTITEKGYFDATHGVANEAPPGSLYTSAVASGDLVFTGNTGWNTFNGDDFTDVDQITFASSSPSGLYTVTRELIDDASGMAISGSYQFTVNLTAAVVIDNTPPVFASTTDVTATTSTSAGAIVHYTNPTATDDMDASVSVTCNPASGSLFALGTTTVTCTAMDNASNTATTTFHVIVSLAPASTTGSITITHPIFVAGLFCATSTPVGLTGTTTANAIVTITGGLSTASTTANGSGAFSLNASLASNATSTILVTARDSGGNVLATTTLNFAIDTTVPTITLNGDRTIIIAENEDFVDPGVTVNDNLGLSASSTVSGSVDIHVPGTYTLTYTATDCAGNTASVTRTVVVSLNPPPPSGHRNPGGGGGGGSFIPPGLLVAVQVANPNSNVANVLAGFVAGPNQGQVLGAATFRFTRTLKFGDRGQDVVELQTRLHAMGFFKAPITGVFGKMTRTAVKAFQKSVDLPPTGNVGPATLNVLNNS